MAVYFIPSETLYHPVTLEVVFHGGLGYSLMEVKAAALEVELDRITGTLVSNSDPDRE